jgi:hypothetical protein
MLTACVIHNATKQIWRTSQKRYSQHPNTGPTGIQMVIFRQFEIRFLNGKMA